MTTVEFLFAVCIIADVLLHCLTLLALRDTLHTLVAQGSGRRLWEARGNHVGDGR